MARGGLLGLSLRGGTSLRIEELAALGHDVRDQVGTGDRRLLARALLDVLDVALDDRSRIDRDRLAGGNRGSLLVSRSGRQPRGPGQAQRPGQPRGRGIFSVRRNLFR